LSRGVSTDQRRPYFEQLDLADLGDAIALLRASFGDQRKPNDQRAAHLSSAADALGPAHYVAALDVQQPDDDGDRLDVRPRVAVPD